MIAFRVVVFDLDGTVVDSSAVMKESFIAAFGRAGCAGEPPFRDFARMSGAALDTIIDTLGLPSEMVELFREESRARVCEVSLVPGMASVCDLLKSAGRNLVLLTGKERDRTEEILEHLRIMDWWDLILTSTDGFAPKPQPDGLIRACRVLGASPWDVASIGDSQGDMLAASAIGSLPVGVTWGVETRTRLVAAGAKGVATRPAGILRIIGRECKRLQSADPSLIAPGGRPGERHPVRQPASSGDEDDRSSDTFAARRTDCPDEVG